MLTHYISIRLNGKSFNCAPDLFLKDLVLYLGFDLNSVIIEHNDQIVQSFLFTAVKIMPGDKIEVLTIVGGG